MRTLIIGSLLFALGCLQACVESAPASGPAAEAAAAEPAPEPGKSRSSGNDIRLAARFGSPDAAFGEVTYKISKGKKKFEVEIENGKPGSKHPVTLDGVEVGTVVVGIKGEGDIELEGPRISDDFPKPRAGEATIKIGKLFEGKLQPLERVIALEAEFKGNAKCEASFKAEKLGGTLQREFELELEDASPETTYVLSVDGREFVTLETDEDGEAELFVAERRGDRFPDDFPELKVGSVIRIGDLVEFELKKKG